MFVVLFHGCNSDAPRDNPLDPVNGMRIEGKVERYYETSAIREAMLVLKPINKTALSAADGSFAIENISPGNYTLVCQAAGFSSDSVELNIQQSTIANFKLNGLPYFRDISLTTHHISSFSAPSDSFFVLFNVAADDHDNRSDVKIVWYRIDDFGFADTLFEENPQEKTFFGELDIRDLGIASLQQLEGKPFTFFVEDQPASVTVSEQYFITRIINTTPTGQSPLNVAASPPLNFEWDGLSLPFNLTFKIEIRKINFSFFTLVGEVNNIPASDTTATFGNPLEQGEYFWVLYIVDEFGNRSRSLENPFIVP